MPRWAICLLVAVVLGLCSSLLPLPSIISTLLYIGAVIFGILFLIYLILWFTGGGVPVRRDRDRL